jgi:Ca2+-binding RTX toxin-like protein
VSERLEASANGTRVRFTRDIASIVMDLNGIENLQLQTLGGTDTVTVDDLSGTDMTNVNVDLAASGGVDDGAIDNVVVNATSGDDFVTVAGAGGNLNVAGLRAAVAITGGSAGPATDVLTVNGLPGNDIIAATGVALGSPSLVLNGDEGNDIIVGGDGNDTITGGDGNDLLIGGPGVDVIDGGTGDNTIAQGAMAGPAAGDPR